MPCSAGSERARILLGIAEKVEPYAWQYQRGGEMGNGRFFPVCERRPVATSDVLNKDVWRSRRKQRDMLGEGMLVDETGRPWPSFG